MKCYYVTYAFFLYGSMPSMNYFGVNLYFKFSYNSYVINELHSQCRTLSTSVIGKQEQLLTRKRLCMQTILDYPVLPCCPISKEVESGLHDVTGLVWKLSSQNAGKQLIMRHNQVINQN